MWSLGLRIGLILAYLAVAAGFSVGVWWYGYTAALDQLEQRGRADLALASDQLSSELERFRELAVLLSDHPSLRPTVLGQGPDQAAHDLVLDVMDKTASLDILVVDTTGKEQIFARAPGLRSHIGEPYFERAMDGALGVHHLYSDRWARRAFLFAAPIFSTSGPVAGAVIVAVDVDELEFDWRGDRPTIYYTDAQGVVFVSNRSELIYRAHPQITDISHEPDDPSDKLRPFFEYAAHTIAGKDIWQVDAGRYLPQRALHMQLNLPLIAMNGNILVDVAPARQQAFLQASVAAALFLAFGALLFLAMERRRTLALANKRLEVRVAQRTVELQKAQADLIQAGKLSALGQMSAGISHELNQPLMAIQSFAENANAFLDRGKTDNAAQNLQRISGLAHRMDRIIKNLRAFSRQESEPLGDVDLVGVVEAALEISMAKAKQLQVALNWTKPKKTILVRGGEVRLQQVLVNLIGNAMDAMEQSPDKTISITISKQSDRVLVHVRDSGPGIAEPEKIFEPFYTTKQVGTSEGMGLGLSISYGLVQSFGGAIRGRNLDLGGAEFTVELDAVLGGK